MTKQITKTVYTYSELSPKAQKVALSYYQSQDNTANLSDEIRGVIDAFRHRVSVKLTRQGDFLSVNEDENVLNLRNVRLRTWILNNWGDWLSKPRYIKTKNGEPSIYTRKIFVLKTYKNYKGEPYYHIYSKNFVEKSCVLTGMYYDDEFLKPIYDFIKKPDDVDLDYIIQDCFQSLRIAYEKECEYLNSEEYFIDECDANEWFFNENGELEQ